MTQNQNNFLNEEEVSNPKRKYSMATIVTAAPRTQVNATSLTRGNNECDISSIGRCRGIKTKTKTRESVAETR